MSLPGSCRRPGRYPRRFLKRTLSLLHLEVTGLADVPVPKAMKLARKVAKTVIHALRPPSGGGSWTSWISCSSLVISCGVGVGEIPFSVSRSKELLVVVGTELMVEVASGGGRGRRGAS